MLFNRLQIFIRLIIILFSMLPIALLAEGESIGRPEAILGINLPRNNEIQRNIAYEIEIYPILSHRRIQNFSSRYGSSHMRQQIFNQHYQSVYRYRNNVREGELSKNYADKLLTTSALWRLSRKNPALLVGLAIQSQAGRAYGWAEQNNDQALISQSIKAYEFGENIISSADDFNYMLGISESKKRFSVGSLRSTLVNIGASAGVGFALGGPGTAVLGGILGFAFDAPLTNFFNNSAAGLIYEYKTDASSKLYSVEKGVIHSLKTPEDFLQFAQHLIPSIAEEINTELGFRLDVEAQGLDLSRAPLEMAMIQDLEKMKAILSELGENQLQIAHKIDQINRQILINGLRTLEAEEIRDLRSELELETIKRSLVNGAVIGNEITAVLGETWNSVKLASLQEEKLMQKLSEVDFDKRSVEIMREARLVDSMASIVGVIATLDPESANLAKGFFKLASQALVLEKTFSQFLDAVNVVGATAADLSKISMELLTSAFNLFSLSFSIANTLTSLLSSGEDPVVSMLQYIIEDLRDLRLEMRENFQEVKSILWSIHQQNQYIQDQLNEISSRLQAVQMDTRQILNHLQMVEDRAAYEKYLEPLERCLLGVSLRRDVENIIVEMASLVSEEERFPRQMTSEMAIHKCADVANNLLFSSSSSYQTTFKNSVKRNAAAKLEYWCLKNGGDYSVCSAGGRSHEKAGSLFDSDLVDEESLLENLPQVREEDRLWAKVTTPIKIVAEKFSENQVNYFSYLNLVLCDLTKSSDAYREQGRDLLESLDHILDQINFPVRAPLVRGSCKNVKSTNGEALDSNMMLRSEEDMMSFIIQDIYSLLKDEESRSDFSELLSEVQVEQQKARSQLVTGVFSNPKFKDLYLRALIQTYKNPIDTSMEIDKLDLIEKTLRTLAPLVHLEASSRGSITRSDDLFREVKNLFDYSEEERHIRNIFGKLNNSIIASSGFDLPIILLNELARRHHLFIEELQESFHKISSDIFNPDLVQSAVSLSSVDQNNNPRRYFQTIAAYMEQQSDLIYDSRERQKQNGKLERDRYVRAYNYFKRNMHYDPLYRFFNYKNVQDPLFWKLNMHGRIYRMKIHGPGYAGGPGFGQGEHAYLYRLAHARLVPYTFGEGENQKSFVFPIPLLGWTDDKTSSQFLVFQQTDETLQYYNRSRLGPVARSHERVTSPLQSPFQRILTLHRRDFNRPQPKDGRRVVEPLSPEALIGFAVHNIEPDFKALVDEMYKVGAKKISNKVIDPDALAEAYEEAFSIVRVEVGRAISRGVGITEVSRDEARYYEAYRAKKVFPDDVRLPRVSRLASVFTLEDSEEYIINSSSVEKDYYLRRSFLDQREGSSENLVLVGLLKSDPETDSSVEIHYYGSDFFSAWENSIKRAEEWALEQVQSQLQQQSLLVVRDSISPEEQRRLGYAIKDFKKIEGAVGERASLSENLARLVTRFKTDDQSSYYHYSRWYDHYVLPWLNEYKQLYSTTERNQELTRLIEKLSPHSISINSFPFVQELSERSHYLENNKGESLTQVFENYAHNYGEMDKEGLTERAQALRSLVERLRDDEESYALSSRFSERFSYVVNQLHTTYVEIEQQSSYNVHPIRAISVLGEAGENR